MKLEEESEDGREALKIDSIEGERDGFDVKVSGESSILKFEAFKFPEDKEHWPKEKFDANELGMGANDVDWTRMKFEGKLEVDGEKKEINGISYFARVCLNIPGMPWKWFYTVFPDSSVFIGFTPYVGPQLLRRKHKFSGSDLIENLTYPLESSGAWIEGDTGEIIEMDEVRVKAKTRENEHPKFKVKGSKEGEGEISFTVDPSHCIENPAERPILSGLTSAKYFYNQHTFSVENFNSTIEEIEVENPENGYGNLEYTWGLWF